MHWKEATSAMSRTEKISYLKLGLGEAAFINSKQDKQDMQAKLKKLEEYENSITR